MQKQIISDSKVCRRYGVSSMTLWRWDRDLELGFPKPIRIRGRKYRDVGELDAFDSERKGGADAPRAA
jgi:predicted DNA-binding transcriptional regulator AlpA